MSSLPEQLAAGAGGTFVTSTWLRRFLIALTVLAWMVIIEMVYAFFGAIKIGAVPIPINTVWTAADYEYLLNDSRASVIIVSAALHSRVVD